MTTGSDTPTDRDQSSVLHRFVGRSGYVVWPLVILATVVMGAASFLSGAPDLTSHSPDYQWDLLWAWLASLGLVAAWIAAYIKT